MTILVRFKCSCCGSWVNQRILVEHREAFKQKVKQRTVRCYSCKN